MKSASIKIMDIKLQYYDQFEYLGRAYRNVKPTAMIEDMNTLGKEGWELIDIITLDNGSKYYIFKRKLMSV